MDMPTTDTECLIPCQCKQMQQIKRTCRILLY